MTPVTGLSVIEGRKMIELFVSLNPSISFWMEIFGPYSKVVDISISPNLCMLCCALSAFHELLEMKLIKIVKYFANLSKPTFLPHKITTWQMY